MENHPVSENHPLGTLEVFCFEKRTYRDVDAFLHRLDEHIQNVVVNNLTMLHEIKRNQGFVVSIILIALRNNMLV
jgi:hypothetical protein